MSDSHAPHAQPIPNRSVLTVAIPIMLSNVSEPMIGVVNTAVIGQLPDPYYIGAIAVGALIFSFIFWGFGFLRMSTGGLSAQALGAGDRTELVAVLIRALMIGLAAGIGLVVLSPFIRDAAFDLVGGSPEIRAHGETYFNYRIFAAPAALSNYCVMGWFIGQSRAKLAFVVQLFLNLTNMALSAFLVLGLGMTSDGVGLAALLCGFAAAKAAALTQGWGHGFTGRCLALAVSLGAGIGIYGLATLVLRVPETQDAWRLVRKIVARPQR